jgi:hypothetical protein
MALNLPTLDEFRRLYGSIGGPGDAINAGVQGFEGGAKLSSEIQARQNQTEARKQALLNAVQALNLKANATAADVANKNAKTAAIENAPDTQDIYTVDDKGNLVKQGSVPKGSKVMSQVDKLGSPIAVSRMATSALNDILKSPDISRNKTIIERGQRIEGIGDPATVVQNPAVLSLVQEAVEAQTRGGVSSAMGVKKLANETPEQFAARLIEKIKNAPQDASVKSFMDQLKSISRQETKAAIRGYQGTILGNAEAAATAYDDVNPKLANAIRASAHKAISGYLNTALGTDSTDEPSGKKGVSDFVDKSAGVGASTGISPEVQAVIDALKD